MVISVGQYDRIVNLRWPVTEADKWTINTARLWPAGPRRLPAGRDRVPPDDAGRSVVLAQPTDQTAPSVCWRYCLQFPTLRRQRLSAIATHRN